MSEQNQSSRRVLIVSPHWPPINAPDMQRVRMSLPYYRVEGWEPVVLAVHPDDVAGTQEPELLDTYPKDVRVHHCRALPLQVTRRIGWSTLGLRAWPGLARTGSALLEKEKFDLVFFSNTQFMTFTLGPVWQSKFGVPYVLDLQDPWRTDHYQKAGAPPPPGGRKYLLARFLARLFEEPTYRRAAGFISVSHRYLDELELRYRWFRNRPRTTIRFGVSAEDFAAARRLGPTELLERKPGEVHLVYTGAAGPIMPHAASALLAALAHYRARCPSDAKRLRLHFCGTSYVSAGMGRPQILPLAEQYGVADLVREIPHRLGHIQSLALQLEADGLMLLGSKDLAYSPSKLYPYYLSGRPMLGLVFSGSYLEEMLRELNCATVVSMTSGGEPTEASSALAIFFANAAKGFTSPEPERNTALFNRCFLSAPLARAQCRFFEQLLPTSRDLPLQ